MRRLLFAWLTVATLGVLNVAEFVPSRARRPNILVIVADDLGYGDVGVHGGRDLPTPNLDALAARGLRCTDAYVAAPYCSPSRAGLLTGRCPTRFGHEFNPYHGDPRKLGLPVREWTVGDRLRRAGYATGLVGKWHQGFHPTYHPQTRGFDEYFGFLGAGHNYLLRQDADGWFSPGCSRNQISRGRTVQKLDGYTTDLFTDEALAFIDRHAGRPWLLYLAYNAVHTPLEVLQKYGSRVPASVTDPERRAYLSLLAGLDDGVGRVMAHLRQTGHDQDTLIFFLSDNGGSGRKPFMGYNAASNAPLRGDKGQTLEGGIRVPFFISWPGHLPAGQTYSRPVSALDILPTACAAGAARTSGELDGVNLLPFLAGREAGEPHAALYWRFGPQKAVRQGRWKLVDWRDFASGRNSGWQLFDLEHDVGENMPLEASHPQVAAELKTAWEAWNRRNVAPRWHGDLLVDPSAATHDSGGD